MGRARRSFRDAKSNRFRAGRGVSDRQPQLREILLHGRGEPSARLGSGLVVVLDLSVQIRSHRAGDLFLNKRSKRDELADKPRVALYFVQLDVLDQAANKRPRVRFIEPTPCSLVVVVLMLHRRAACKERTLSHSEEGGKRFLVHRASDAGLASAQGPHRCGGLCGARPDEPSLQPRILQCGATSRPRIDKYSWNERCRSTSLSLALRVGRVARCSRCVFLAHVAVRCRDRCVPVEQPPPRLHHLFQKESCLCQTRSVSSSIAAAAA